MIFDDKNVRFVVCFIVLLLLFLLYLFHLVGIDLGSKCFQLLHAMSDWNADNERGTFANVANDIDGAIHGFYHLLYQGESYTCSYFVSTIFSLIKNFKDVLLLLFGNATS